MKDGAPQQVYAPQVIEAHTFTIDGEKVEIREPDSYAAFVWIPGNKAILGGTASPGTCTSGPPIPDR
ncbi:Uncharacterised protein [Raoultella terrigena]|uniref:Uncharacterized protein n=1 Tax=Raoultella terrigena TaxID=577 RepID=A0A3P8M2I8_RAOTE|nr:Uncharacterised protein [Raoultella terrigena]